MKHFYFLSLFFSFFIPFVLDAQICTGDFIFNTQAELDQFLIDHPTCNSVEGSIYIGLFESETDPILNFDALANINTISGILSIKDKEDYSYIDEVIDFSGLLGLTQVQSLQYKHYSSSVDLSFFDNIQSVRSVNIDLDRIEENWIVDYEEIFPSLIEADSIVFSFHMVYADSSIFISGFNSIDSCKYVAMYSSDWGNYNYLIDQLYCFNNLVHTDNLYLGLAAHDYNSFSILNSIGSFGYFDSGLGITPFNDEQFITAVVTLPVVTHIDDIYIQSRDFIVNFNFPQLTSAGSVYATEFPNLYLDALTTVEEDFIMSGFWGYGYLTLSANALQQIGGDFYLQQIELVDPDFLNHITSVGADISLVANLNLSNCNSEVICARIASNVSSITIDSNAVGCQNIDEVAVLCSGNYVMGTVFADLDCDGIMNNGDFGIDYSEVYNAQDEPVAISQVDGSYTIALDYDSTYSFVPNLLGFLPVAPQTITTLGVPAIITGQNFALCPDDSYHGISVELVPLQPCKPGFETNFKIILRNHGNHVETGNIVVNLSAVNTTAILVGLGGVMVGYNMEFAYTDLSPYSTITFNFLLVYAPTIPLGSTQSLTVMTDLSSATDQDLSDNTALLNMIAVGSFDPNDISVNIPEQNFAEFPANGLTLDYIIRFQNTGTAPAEFVTVRDIIEEDLVLSSIDVLGTSHPFQFSFNENRELEWLFENIQLPDSTTDLEGSQGYIHYRIKTNPNVTIDDIIENTAAIYFDYNEPVITNTATTIFYTCPEQITATGTTAVCEGETIELNASQGWENYQWMLGNEVVGDQSSISLEGLASGIYNLNYSGSTQYCESMDMLELDILGIPQAPTIIQNGNTLTASGSGLFTWMLDGVLLDEMGNTLTITQTGNYSVMVNTNGCESDMTSSEFIFIGVEELGSGQLSIYPNPTSDLITISLPENLAVNAIVVTDMLGKEVMRITKAMNRNVVVDCSVLPNGIYQLHIGSSNKTLIKQ
jgi:uncharacterized repeat protein (TIGR01451 family)